MLGWSLPPVVIDDICVYLLNGVQHFVLLYVFLFVVPCCGVRYDFRIKTLFMHRCFKHVFTMGVTRRVSYKRQELLTNCEHLSSPLFLVGFVLLIFLVFCVVFLCFICLRCVSCLPNVASISGLFILDCPFVLPASLDCSFLIAPSVFSTVYYATCIFLRIPDSYLCPVQFPYHIIWSCRLTVAQQVFTSGIGTPN